eukprot:6473408-Amphidinium_carterae.1
MELSAVTAGRFVEEILRPSQDPGFVLVLTRPKPPPTQNGSKVCLSVTLLGGCSADDHDFV